MPITRWSRAHQMWAIVIVCILLFAGGVAIIPGLTRTMYWEVIGVAALATAICVGIFEVWLRRMVGRRDQAITFLHRVTTGDLTLSAQEIVDATRSARMAA